MLLRIVISFFCFLFLFLCLVVVHLSGLFFAKFRKSWSDSVHVFISIIMFQLQSLFPSTFYFLLSYVILIIFLSSLLLDDIGF